MPATRGLALLLAFAAWGAAQPAKTASAVGRSALDLLLAENYSALGPLLTDAGQQKLTPQFLRERVEPELKSFGTMLSIGQPVLGRDEKNSLVSFPVKFTEVTVNIQFTLNESMRVAGLYLRPANAPLPPVWKAPSYSHAELFHDRTVAVGVEPWKLRGTFSVPSGKGPFPGVVLVHGPGPNDRDESIFATKMFRDIAEGLASKGIAVLRYDKRTKVYGDKMSEMEFTIREETVDDAAYALAFLRQQPEIDARRTFLVAHSLGGYIAPRIAAQDGKLAGIVFLAANARPVEDMALEQNTYVAGLNGELSPEAQQRLDGLKAEVARVKQLQPGKPAPPVLMGLPSAYLMDLRGYDATASAKALRTPLLFLQGERDFQVTMKDFNLWKQAPGPSKTATFRSFPALNHLFIAGEGKPSPLDYRLGGSVDAHAVDAMATWIAVQSAKTQ